jgi:hypothetical protein
VGHRTIQRAVEHEHHAAPLPLLAPHLFRHVCKVRSGKPSAPIWPTIRESLEDCLKNGSIEPSGVTNTPDAETGAQNGSNQRFPALAAASATSDITLEIDEMIHASAANALDMTSSNTAALSGHIPVASPKACADGSISSILEDMVCDP